MTPVFLASTLTSCEKLEELLGGDDEGDDDGDGSSSGNLNGVGTTDGAAPYFNLESTRIEVPAVRDGEGIQVKCQTNIISMRYVLEKFKKFSEGELTEQEDYSFILEIRSIRSTAKNTCNITPTTPARNRPTTC